MPSSVVLALCTGCELCIAPCPVDCIVMVPRASVAHAPPAPGAQENRERYAARSARLATRSQEHAALLSARKQAATAASRGS